MLIMIKNIYTVLCAMPIKAHFRYLVFTEIDLIMVLICFIANQS